MASFNFFNFSKAWVWSIFASEANLAHKFFSFSALVCSLSNSKVSFFIPLILISILRFAPFKAAIWFFISKTFSANFSNFWFSVASSFWPFVSSLFFLVNSFSCFLISFSKFIPLMRASLIFSKRSSNFALYLLIFFP